MAKRKQRKGGGKAEKTPGTSHARTRTKAKAGPKPKPKAQESAVPIRAVPAIERPADPSPVRTPGIPGPPDTPGTPGLSDSPGTPVAPAPLPNAATLLDELQQRCESLRQWQRQANEDVQARLARIKEREAELDEAARLTEHDRTHLDLDLDALKRARLIFDKEKAQAEQTQQALEAERLRQERTRAEQNDQRQELQALRSELDAEWASLARVRRAQESLAAALDADRIRIQEQRLAEALRDRDTRAPGEGSDDGPGLSLTQAA
jgi:hypothetical protein